MPKTSRSTPTANGHRPRPHIASEDEIVAVAAELGYLDEQGNYPRHLRKKLAQVVNLSAAELESGAAAQIATDAIVDELAAIYTALADKLPADVAGRVVAHLAPTIYNRTTPRGNRTP